MPILDPVTGVGKIIHQSETNTIKTIFLENSLCIVAFFFHKEPRIDVGGQTQQPSITFSHITKIYEQLESYSIQINTYLLSINNNLYTHVYKPPTFTEPCPKFLYWN